MIKHDIHVHTHLSACAHRDAFISGYIAEAKRIGLTTVGFADHAWDEAVSGASDWYKPQTFSRLESRKSEIKTIDTDGLKVLFGAEGEFANFLLGIGEDARQYVDYIIVPHSHTHMKGFVMPSEYSGDAKAHAKFLTDSFIALCSHKDKNLFVGIAHPMWPVGASIEYIKQIFDNISDSTLDECAQAAKESELMLEVNLSSLKSIPPEYGEEFCIRRFFEACKRADCEFFMGSDAHRVTALAEYHETQSRVINIIGMEESSFTAAERRISIL